MTVVLFLLALLMMPVSVDFRASFASQVRWQLRIRLLGIPLPPLRSENMPRLREEMRERKGPRPPVSPQVKTAFLIARQFFRARRPLVACVRLDRLDAAIRPSLSSAASTALLSGGASGLLSLLPGTWKKRARIVVLPDFASPATYGQFRCMFSFPLGTILSAAAIVLVAIVQARRRGKRKPAQEHRHPCSKEA